MSCASHVTVMWLPHTPDFFTAFSLWQGRAKRDRDFDWLPLGAWPSDWDRDKFSVTVLDADSGEVLSNWLLLSNNEVTSDSFLVAGNEVISNRLLISDEVTWLIDNTVDSWSAWWSVSVGAGDVEDEELSLSSLVVLTLLGGVSSSFIVSISSFPVSVSMLRDLYKQTECVGS